MTETGNNGSFHEPPDFGDEPSPYAGNGLWRPQLEWIYAQDIEPRLNTPALVKGVLEREQLSLMFGNRGCGKTFLALDMALRIATGMPWFGCATSPCGVVYLALEAGRSLANRVWAWLHEHSLIGHDIPFAYIPTPLDLCHAKEGDVQRLLETIDNHRKGWKVDLIIPDTVSRAMAGGDENSPEDAGGYIRSCGLLQTQARCAVMSVAHSGYANTNRVRGHSSIPFAIDTELIVKHNEQTGLCTATVSRQRDGVAGTEFNFSLRQVTVGYDPDGDAVTTCLVEPQTGAATPDRKSAKLRRPLSPRLTRALGLLDLALGKAGTQPDNANIPPATSCVKRQLWRAYCRDGGLTDRDSDEAERKAFARCADDLIAQGHVGCWQDWVWITTR